MGEKLTWAEIRAYDGPEDLDEALAAIDREKPVAILADVKNPFTLSLLDEYRKRKQNLAAFLVTGDEGRSGRHRRRAIRAKGGWRRHTERYG
ncbi:MAG: hypothetical protein M5R38_10330 [Candidatus Methylomirabilis sp.]|nr:hypothetical protein [Candidatus Methylomirabilis sp.]